MLEEEVSLCWSGSLLDLAMDSYVDECMEDDLDAYAVDDDFGAAVEVEQDEHDELLALLSPSSRPLLAKPEVLLSPVPGHLSPVDPAASLPEPPAPVAEAEASAQATSTKVLVPSLPAGPRPQRPGPRHYSKGPAPPEGPKPLGSRPRPVMCKVSQTPQEEPKTVTAPGPLRRVPTKESAMSLDLAPSSGTAVQIPWSAMAAAPVLPSPRWKTNSELPSLVKGNASAWSTGLAIPANDQKPRGIDLQA